MDIIDLTTEDNTGETQSGFNDGPTGCISMQDEMMGDAEPQNLSVYLRVRPFSKEELSDNEDQSCVVTEDSQTVMLHAPKGSANMKSSERGIGLSHHKFTFSQIFGPETKQADLFESTIKSHVSDYLDGQNALIFTYGVTSSGKTYTVHGSAKEPGLLPRALCAIFQHIRGRQYEGMDLKPYRGSDAQKLGPDQVKQERVTKAAIFKEESEVKRKSSTSSTRSTSRSSMRSRSSSSSSINSLSASSDQTELGSTPVEPDGSQFALWVAFYEIYNEYVYDLLQPPSFSRSNRRAALRVCEDSAGHTYVRDIKWINIQNLEEACKLLRFGNKHRSAASTKMNQSSSRSHSIFTMKLMKIDGATVERISEFSLCDLAGSERCNKAKTFGDRLKEAGNINNSLFILGKCITALRNNQTDGRMKSGYIPFRESKLTKIFQNTFCGNGRTSMIVNIQPCASTYDETLNVMKFSAIASQVVQAPLVESLESLAPVLVGRDGKPLLGMESVPSDDELLDEEDEVDMSILPQEDLLITSENLRAKLTAERRKNLVQEIEIRKEMGDAMLKLMIESEELHRRKMAALKESYQERMDQTFELYRDAVKEHAYQSAMNRIEDHYVPIDEFIDEQEKVETLTRKVSQLEDQLSKSRTGQPPIPTLDSPCQTENGTQQPCQTENGTQQPAQRDEADAERCNQLYMQKCAVENMCVDKQTLIASLEKQLAAQTESLQLARSNLADKSAKAEALQMEVDEQAKHTSDLLRRYDDQDKEITSLKQDIARLSSETFPVVQPKPKRGLLANIKLSVTSPRKGPLGRSLRKTSSQRSTKKISE